MATILEQEDKDQDQLQTIGAPTGTSSTTPGAPVTGQPQRQGSGRATNVRQYLEANQGAGQQLGQGIQQKAQQTAGQVQQGAKKTRSRFEQAATPLEQQLGDEAQSTIQTAFKDPQQLLQQQQQLQQFQTLRDQGLQQQIGGLAQDTRDISQQARGLQEDVGLAGTEGGRFQLLQRTFGQPDYGRGQQRLDQLFLQASPVRDLQSQLGQQAELAQGAVTGTEEDIQNRIGALQDISAQRAQEIQDLLYGGAEEGIEAELGQRGLTDISGDLEKRLKETRDLAPEQLAQFQESIGKDKFTQEELAALGLDPGAQLFDIDLGQYISGQAPEATLAGIANPEEFARYQALRQLSGDQADIFSGMGEDQIGGYSPYAADVGGIQEFLTQRGEQAQQYQEQTQKAGEGFYDMNKKWIDAVIGAEPDSQLGQFYQSAKQLSGGYDPQVAQQFLESFQQIDPNVAFGGLDAPQEIEQYNQLKELAKLYSSQGILDTTRRAAGPDLEEGGVFNV